MPAPLDASRASRASTARYALALFLLITTARIIYVSLFAVQTPFWDQWDGEAAYLLKPWQDGTWSFWQLFSLHNEHRIAFTRLSSLLVFEMNGEQWNNLVSAYVNAPLAGGYLTLLFVLLVNDEAPLVRSGMFAAVTIVGLLPYSWENFLVGFQNQFYFMALLAIVAMAIAAFRPDNVRYALLTGVVAGLALLTSAGGFVGAVGVIVIIAAHAWRRSTVSRIDVFTATLMLMVVATGVVTTPTLADHEVLHAVGIRDNVNALVTALMWPVQPTKGSHFLFQFKIIAVVVIWLPAALWTWRFLRERMATPAGLLALGVSAWGFVQAVAIAHSRGHGMDILPSRYTDLPAVTVVANAWFALELVVVTRRPILSQRVATAAAVSFFVVAGYGFVSRRHEDMARMASRAHYNGLETSNVAGYMRSGDPTWLAKPLMEIPYPDPERLRTLLDDPTIAGMLPPEVKKRSSSEADPAPLSVAATAIQETVTNTVNEVAPRLKSLEPDTRTPVSPKSSSTAPAPR
jgi:hypothetical protein